ncbi:MAG: hypothetical protein P2A85_15660 [Microcoleus anatoxicus]|uniref:hypothetical protein n=1 Tax=Microcoleus anatoxicus TaxID=2705319 RepID=UPI00366A65B5
MISEEPNNNNIAPDGIHIEIMLPEPTVLAIPENKPNANAPVHLNVRITNNSLTPYYYNICGTWFPEIIAPDGQVLPRHLAVDEPVGQKSVTEPSVTGWRIRLAQFISNLIRQPFRQYRQGEYVDPSLVFPGSSIGIALHAQLFWCNNLLQIQFPTIDFYWNTLNQYWSFDLGTEGIYQLRFIYLNNSQNIVGYDLEIRESQIIQESKFSQLTSPFANLHLVEPMNPNRSAVEIDGIRFETIVLNRVLNIPEKNSKKVLKSPQETFCNEGIPVEIGIRISNNTENPLHFSFYATCMPELISADGEIQEMGCGSDGYVFPTESDFPLVLPGKCLMFFPEAKILCVRGNVLRLVFKSSSGGYWWFDNLTYGIYQFRFRYQKICKSRSSDDTADVSIEQILSETAWSGRVDTPFIELHLLPDSS